MAAEAAEQVLQGEVRQSEVRRMLERAFGREERAVLKTQQFDAAPGGLGDPDRGYHHIVDAALARSRCGRVLDGTRLDAVIAYWTAQGLAQERQQQYHQQVVDEGRSDAELHFRPLERREYELWRLKDEACVRLHRPVMDGLNRTTQPPADLVLDLIREWAGLIDPGQRARLAAAYQRTERAARYLKAGRRDRGQVGVQQILDSCHHAALDQLAEHLTAADVGRV